MFECEFSGCDNAFETITDLKNHQEDTHGETDRATLKVQIDKLIKTNSVWIDGKLV